ncbi:MAG: Mannosylglucosylglycerate synthase [Anaerolineales bacterium]|nr:Mannosylglucosylglycerate synthase [Anaerolineales bacterium]
MNIGFVSTRLAGTDGVSLETAKLAEVGRRLGHQVFYCAGELDPDGPPGRLVPEMHFAHAESRAIHDTAFGQEQRPPDLIARIHEMAAHIQSELVGFVEEFGIDVIVPQNALAIPMGVPLGVALTNFIAETGIPTVAHHHDFYWERKRFIRNCIPDVLDSAFPPNLPSMQHLVINSLAQKALARRRGIVSTVLPNVFDFATPAPDIDEYNADFRAAIDVSDDDVLILQPTRVIQRKNIERAIDLCARLAAGDRGSGRDIVLCVTHEAGDEGQEYQRWLDRQAARAGVHFIWAAEHVAPERRTENGRKVYSLWDAYPHTDFVTYPSDYEGFGNALIETVYFQKPMLVNRYPVYEADIAPKGFDFVEIDGMVTAEAVGQIWELLRDDERRQAMVERNFALGQKHFSYEVLEEILNDALKHAHAMH